MQKKLHRVYYILRDVSHWIFLISSEKLPTEYRITWTGIMHAMCNIIIHGMESEKKGKWAGEVELWLGVMLIGRELN